MIRRKKSRLINTLLLVCAGIAFATSTPVYAGEPIAVAQSEIDAVEVEFWQSVKETTDPEELKAYLQTYPNGKFAALARIRLRKLEPAGPSPNTNESAPKPVTEPTPKPVTAPVTTPVTEPTPKPATAPEPSEQPAGALQTASEAPPIHECDHLAAHPEDPLSVTEGVAWVSLVAAPAIAACREALATHPMSARFEFQLGRAYQKDKQFEHGLELYRRASAQRYGMAFVSLGVIYDSGLGVAQDYAKAAKLYRRAAERGIASAHYNLGRMFVFGEGVPQDFSEALRWLRMAADQGHAKAQYSIGYMYENGIEVPRDIVETGKWYRRAANQGDAFAQNNLGEMYEAGQGVPRDLAEALKWFRKAAGQGLARAEYNIGKMYLNGHEVPQDRSEAIRLWRRAARFGIDAAVKGLRILGEQPYDLIEIQSQLAKLGYYPGSIDGNSGRKTREAIRRFQTDKGLTANGRPSLEFANALQKAVERADAEQQDRKSTDKAAATIAALGQSTTSDATAPELRVLEDFATLD